MLCVEQEASVLNLYALKEKFCVLQFLSSALKYLRTNKTNRTNRTNRH